MFWAVLLALRFAGVENIDSWTALVRHLLEFGP
jgi:hypothetical protein